MRVAYFDCFSGAGGDMIVASLIHAGAEAALLSSDLDSLAVGGYTLTIEPINKQGFAATRFHVALEDPKAQPDRHLADIVRILDESRLSDAVKEQAKHVFRRLAEAEAKVHGTSIERVHFHEVGAVDAIVDVVGAILALEQLGVDRIHCSEIPTGSGTVKCAHGVMPIPAPATAELLRGVPLASCSEIGEMVTPTAAAILTTLVHGFGPAPRMTVNSIGYGAGTREGKHRPNVLRVMIGQATTNDELDEITVLETNLDDASPETVGHCFERLIREGALDVYAVPIHMKKSRSGVVLIVLCENDRVGVMERILFSETTTFGIRRHRVERTTLQRRQETVDTPYGEVRMKVGEGFGVVTASPEYEDCRRAAAQHGVALRDVMAAANRSWDSLRTE